MTDRKGGSLYNIRDVLIMEREEMKNKIKLPKLKSGFSEEAFWRELSKIRRKAMVKNVEIKPPPRSTSAIVKLMVRNQKSEEHTVK